MPIHHFWADLIWAIPLAVFLAIGVAVMDAKWQHKPREVRVSVRLDPEEIVEACFMAIFIELGRDICGDPSGFFMSTLVAIIFGAIGLLIQRGLLSLFSQESTTTSGN